MFVNIDARGRFQCRLLGTLGQIDLQGCRKYERRGHHEKISNRKMTSVIDAIENVAIMVFLSFK